MKLDLTFDVNGSADEFWKLYFDEEFTRRLHLEALGSVSVDVVELTGDVAGGLTRTLRYGQRPDMPGPVRKLFGSEVVTTESGTFDPLSNTWTFTLTPGTLADKTEMTGSLTLVENSGSWNQRFQIEAKVKIFGVGPIVERFIEGQARSSQERAANFINQALTG